MTLLTEDPLLVGKKRRDRDFRFSMFFQIICFLAQNFAEGHKIRTLGSIDLIFFEMTIMHRRFELNMFETPFQPISMTKKQPKLIFQFREYLVGGANLNY
jgi:hypothetical protein